MVFRVDGDNARSLVLTTESSTDWGDVRLSLEFSLGWGTGKVMGNCDPGRVAELRAALDKLAEGLLDSVEFITTDGNIDLTIRMTSTGKALVSGIAIPDMTQDERVRFDVVGVLEREPA